MKQLLITALFVFCAVTGHGETSSFESADLSHPGMYFQLGAGTDPDSVGGEAGFFGYENENLSYVTGLAFLASEQFEDFFVGVNLGLRIGFHDVISPFAGLGVFAGYSEKKVSAEDDDQDNDDDGDIDEEGEEKEVIDNVIGAVYPEVGLIIRTSAISHVILSGRYYVTTEGHSEDFWIYSLGFGFQFE